MTESTCSVVFDNGVRCPRKPSRVTGLCKDCSRWAHKYGQSPQGRKHKRGNGELHAAVRSASESTSNECVYVDHGVRLFVRYEGKSQPAARVVWTMAHGSPGALHVLHRCHNGDVGCININCLYLGTPAQNMRDMTDAGRSAKGADHGNAHLTPEQVRAIRAKYVRGSKFPHTGNSRVLGLAFGVHPAYIRELCRGERWAHLTDADEH